MRLPAAEAEWRPRRTLSSGDALRLWEESRDPRGTPAERYLREHRELDLPDDVAGSVLRFHPRCPWRDENTGRNERSPALIGLFRSIDDDTPMGIHRVLLGSDGNRFARRTLGPMHRCAIKLGIQSGDDLVIGEGVETCLAARQLGISGCAWACCSAGMISHFPVLDGIGRLTILGEQGRASAVAVSFCAPRWQKAGRKVRVMMPAEGDDMNDEWMRGHAMPYEFTPEEILRQNRINGDEAAGADPSAGSGGKASNAPPSLPAITAASLAGLAVPPRLWHVEDLIPARTVTLLSGDGGTGKSLLALHLAAATTQGAWWAGRQASRGPAVYLSAEDDLDELHRRLAAIAAALEIGLKDLCDLTIVPMAGLDALLAVPKGKTNILEPTAVFGAFENLVKDKPGALFVIDTLADAFGGEENQRAHARQFVGMLRGLCIRHRATALVPAHPSVRGMESGSGSSGSTGWNNSVRSRLYLERVKAASGEEDDPNLRVLRSVKSNYGSTGHEIPLRWKAGVFLPGSAGSSDSFAVIAAHAKAERIFLNMVAAYRVEGRFVSAAPSPNYAPAVFAKDPRADGIRNAGFVAAMNRLFETGRIRVEEFGRPSRIQTRIVIAQRDADQ